MRNKGIAIAVAGGATAVGRGMGANQAQAIFSGAKRKELVEFLSEALDKDPEAIQEAFENMGTNHQTDSKVAVGQKLEKSLDSDKISRDQKKLILVKHLEMRQQRQSDWAVKPDFTRKNEVLRRQKQRIEMKAWARANGINFRFLNNGTGNPNGHRMGG